MNFYSRNRNLVIEVEDEKQQQQNGVFLPDDYVKAASRLKVAKVIDAQSGQFQHDVGSYVLFEAHMMQTFDHEGKKYSIIPESAVYGVFKNGPHYKESIEY